MNIKLWDKKETINGQQAEAIFKELPWTNFADTILVQSGKTTLYIENADIIRDITGLDEDASLEDIMERYKEYLQAHREPAASAQAQINALVEENERLRAENADIVFALMDGGLI